MPGKVFVVPWGAAGFYWDALKQLCGTVCVKATDPRYCVTEEKSGCTLHQRCAPWHPVTLGGIIAIGPNFEPGGVPVHERKPPPNTGDLGAAGTPPRGKGKGGGSKGKGGGARDATASA